MKVYLIRHASAFVDMTGQKPVKQWHLKPEGAALSGQLGEVVGGLERPPQLLISSSQLKAFETGAHMARALGVPLALNDAFGEVSAGVSKFLGPRYAEIMKYLFEHQDASLFGEANFADAKARFTEGLAALVREQQLAGLESLGIVSHSGVLSLAYQSFAGGELEEIEKSMKFPDVAALEFKENGSFEGLIEPFGQHLLVPPVIPEEEKEAHKVIIDEIDQALREQKADRVAELYKQLGVSPKDPGVFNELSGAFGASTTEWNEYRERQIPSLEELSEQGREVTQK